MRRHLAAILFCLVHCQCFATTYISADFIVQSPNAKYFVRILNMELVPPFNVPVEVYGHDATADNFNLISKLTLGRGFYLPERFLLSDDGRYLVVFDESTNAVVSIYDVQNQEIAKEFALSDILPEADLEFLWKQPYSENFWRGDYAGFKGPFLIEIGGPRAGENGEWRFPGYVSQFEATDTREKIRTEKKERIRLWRRDLLDDGHI